MKKKLRLTLIAVFVFFSFFVSCKKEKSCEGCRENNKPPIAVAGPDQLITLPTDSVLLDGSTSSDPDGIISSYGWAKISGPASFSMGRPSDSITKAKTLVKGSYEFELKVTDNSGLSSKDTVQIIVNDPANRPPIANAGSDQTITLPANTVTFNGSGSTDPDNNITSYTWTKISGPTSFSITNSNTVQTQVTSLVQGTYQFELTVRDAGGLFDLDTVEVSVNSNSVTVSCDNSTRPIVNAQLIPYTTIPNQNSAPNFVYKSIAAANKLIFVPQVFYNSPTCGCNPIYIFDIVSNSWSTVELSTPRSGVGIAVHNNKVYFAGGGYSDFNGFDTTYHTIDIYDAVSGTWSVSSLNVPGYCDDGAELGDKLFFPSGNIVQIFNTITGTCTTAPLSIPRLAVSAITAGNKVYFAGGDNLSGGRSDRVDVYDNTTSGWSYFSMIEPKAYIGSIFANNTIFWAGGFNSPSQNYNSSSLVELYNISTQSSSSACLFKPKADFKAVFRDNKIIFFVERSGNPENRFDIYDISTNTWSVGMLPVNFMYSTIISYNNTIYVAGGIINGNPSQQVWKLEF